MQPDLAEWAAECAGSRPRFNLLRAFLWDGPLSGRLSSWGETLRETCGDEPEVVFAAYEHVKELRAKWLRGIAWHDRSQGAVAEVWEANWEKTEQRGREYGAAADDLCDWFGCEASELREMLEFDEARTIA